LIETYNQESNRLFRDGIKRTGAMKASAIVMNPRNGQVMAMANYPTFNPQKLQDVKDVSVFNNDVCVDAL